MSFWHAALADWPSIAALLIGLVGIFAAGFVAGRLWQRGDYVRRVMVGEVPPPWDQPGDDLYLDDETVARVMASLRARTALYDWERES